MVKRGSKLLLFQLDSLDKLLRTFELGFQCSIFWQSVRQHRSKRRQESTTCEDAAILTSALIFPILGVFLLKCFATEFRVLKSLLGCCASLIAGFLSRLWSESESHMPRKNQLMYLCRFKGFGQFFPYPSFALDKFGGTSLQYLLRLQTLSLGSSLGNTQLRFAPL
jgi:hypothetical protein